MTEQSPRLEQAPKIEQLNHGRSVVYVAEIKPRSFMDMTQDENMQSRALHEIVRKMKSRKETVLGTALITTAETDDWLANKMHSNLVVIGASTVVHPRPALDEKLESQKVMKVTPETMVMTYVMPPSWRKLYTGAFAAENLRPIAAFADQAIGKFGNQININIDTPNLGSFITYMTATKR